MSVLLHLPLVYLSPGSIRGGQDECKNCALSWITLQSERAAVGLNDTFADIQPQARGWTPA